MTETVEEAQKRYDRACHAMQSGVAMCMNYDPVPTEPKHLRVGVNSTLVSLGALTELLIDKGIITQTEYFTTLANAMEAEVTRYEAVLSVHFGRDITLH